MQDLAGVVNFTADSSITGFKDVTTRGITIEFDWVKVQIENADPSKVRAETRLRLTKIFHSDSTRATQFVTEDQAKAMYPAEWDYFNKTGDMPVTGTALTEIPNLSTSQLQQLTLRGLRSVEDLLNLNGSVLENLGLDGRMAYQTAKEWMRRKTDSAEAIDVAELRTKMEDALASTTRRAETAEAQMKALAAEVTALRSVAGRPDNDGLNEPVARGQADNTPMPSTPLHDMEGQEDDVLAG